jgi:hypothetical protein
MEPRQYHLSCQLPHSRSVSVTAQSHHICSSLRAGTAPSFFRAPSSMPGNYTSHRRAPDKGNDGNFMISDPGHGGGFVSVGQRPLSPR